MFKKLKNLFNLTNTGGMAIRPEDEDFSSEGPVEMGMIYMKQYPTYSAELDSITRSQQGIYFVKIRTDLHHGNTKYHTFRCGDIPKFELIVSFCELAIKSHADETGGTAAASSSMSKCPCCGQEIP